MKGEATMEGFSKLTRFAIGMAVVACLCLLGMAAGVLSGEELIAVIGLGGFGVATVLDDELNALAAQVKANTDAEDSATAVLNQIPTMIQAAVAKALAAGATPAQLQAITDLQTALKAHADTLSAAVVANTPAG
jgi:hypothetical protein